jgi:GNAT superfamily N-acetyltransferase
VKDLNVRILNANHSDLPKIVELLHDDDIGGMRESLDESAAKLYYSALEDIDRDQNCELLVARIESLVIGCLVVNYVSGLSYRGAKRCLVEDVRLAQSHRKMGIGRLLMSEVERRANLRGCQIIQLLAHKDRSVAKKFYERLGFEAGHIGFRKILTV